MFNFSKKLFLISALMLVSAISADFSPASVSITKVQSNPAPTTPPTPVPLGSEVTYTITVTNTSDESISCIELEDFFTPCTCESPFIRAIETEGDLGFKFSPTIDGFFAKTHSKLEAGESFTIQATFKACFSKNFSPIGNAITNTIRFNGKQGCERVAGCANYQTPVTACDGAALAVSISPIPTICVVDSKTQVVPAQVFACPGGEITLESTVTGECGKILYQWFKAALVDTDCPTAVVFDPTTCAIASDTLTWVPVGHDDPELKDITTTVCPDITVDCPTLTPGFAYVLVVTDTCTGCCVISNPICVTIFPCADLEIDKTCVSRDCDKTTFQITVTNNGPCNSPAGTVVVQDCLPCGLKLANICAPDWTVKIVNGVEGKQCIQAIYNPTLLNGSTTSPITAKVRCCKDSVNTATVFTTCLNDFDSNLSNNTASLKIKCKHR